MQAHATLHPSPRRSTRGNAWSLTSTGVLSNNARDTLPLVAWPSTPRQQPDPTRRMLRAAIVRVAGKLCKATIMERGSAAAGSLDDLPPQYVGNSGSVVQLRNTSEDPVGPKQIRKLVANE
ncbi:hypothetical protein FB451DRAFT_1167532 [Mycena latifolia]|nr:hypothetical protein FB451DRAFT_1167532 [Mycena latifolia]